MRELMKVDDSTNPRAAGSPVLWSDSHGLYDLSTYYSECWHEAHELESSPEGLYCRTIVRVLKRSHKRDRHGVKAKLASSWDVKTVSRVGSPRFPT